MDKSKNSKTTPQRLNREGTMAVFNNNNAINTLSKSWQ